MKIFKIVSFVLVLMIMSVAVVPVQAQLGGTQKSSFTIQNINNASTSVEVTFINENGDKFVPAVLRPATATAPALPNPFDLPGNSAVEIYVPGIPANLLPPGRYSVMISSGLQVVATANLLGEGAINFNGAYGGFAQETGATKYYLPAFIFNQWGWWSAISVQNVGDAPTNVTVTVTCDNNPALTGTLTKTNLLPQTSVTFDTKSVVPTGFTSGSKCNGSAVVQSTASNIVAVDNQTLPAGGNTQTFSGVSAGFTKLYVPALYVSYYGWNASLNLQKLEAGNATVTIAYSDGAASTTCNLTDAAPSCLVYMPDAHPLNGAPRAAFGAVVTSSGPRIVGVVNASTATGQAQTYNAIGAGTNTVVAPGLLKTYYGWNSSITCQNISSTPTQFKFTFQGVAGSYTPTDTYTEGKTVEVYVPNVPGVPNKYTGGVTVEAVNTAAQISCVINHTNDQNQGKVPGFPAVAGDWSMSTNAFNR